MERRRTSKENIMLIVSMVLSTTALIFSIAALGNILTKTSGKVTTKCETGYSIETKDGVKTITYVPALNTCKE